MKYENHKDLNLNIGVLLFAIGLVGVLLLSFHKWHV